MSSKKTVEIVTTTLETGKIVLAKKERLHQEEISSPEQAHNTHVLTPLRYGNETRALAKIESIRSQLEEIGRIATAIKREGRFLVFVSDKPGIQTISIESVEEMMLARRLEKKSKPYSSSAIFKRPPFATITGQL